MNHNPQGTVERADSSATNILHVRGKAYDLDNARASTRLHLRAQLLRRRRRTEIWNGVVDIKGQAIPAKLQSLIDNPQNYLINLSNPSRVALRDYKTNLTFESARALFQNAQSGDFVQIRRRHGGPHSGIFVKRTRNGILLFEANEDGRNSIRTNNYSYSDLANRNFAMSLYYAK